MLSISTAPIQLFLNHCLHCRARTGLALLTVTLLLSTEERLCGAVLLLLERLPCCMVLMRYCSRWGEALRCGGALTKERLSTEERLCGAVLLSLGGQQERGLLLVLGQAENHGRASAVRRRASACVSGRNARERIDPSEAWLLGMTCWVRYGNGTVTVR